LDHEIKAAYFNQLLSNIPHLILDCCFNWIYSVDKRSAWIFFEMLLFDLTHSNSLAITPDNLTYKKHINEFLTSDLSSENFLRKYKYKTAEEGDLKYIINHSSILKQLYLLFAPEFGTIQRILDPVYGYNPDSEAPRNSYGILVEIKKQSFWVRIDNAKGSVSLEPIGTSMKDPPSPVMPRTELVRYSTMLKQIPNVLDYGEGEKQCRDIGELINKKWGMDGMVLVCDFIRDELHDRMTYASVERAWNGIGDWMA
jgi:hypothetical protein